MTLTAKDVAEILRLLEQSNFDSFRLEMNGLKLDLRRGSPAAEALSSRSVSPSVAPPSESGPARRTARTPSQPGLADIPSPFVGVLYRAPRPGERPFVAVGSRVEKDTLIGIIEMMKMMNPVRAGLQGEVVEILVENGAPVEYGEILMRVRPGPSDVSS